jgi:beta-galactosidase
MNFKKVHKLKIVVLLNSLNRDKNISLPGNGNVDRLDILVENLGRVNYGAAHNFYQKKGLWEGDVLVDRERVLGWAMTPLEFKKSFVNG